MATLDHYAAALRYVHIQALLLAEDYSPNGVDGLKVALERHLMLLIVCSRRRGSASFCGCNVRLVA